jgi:glycerol-3-phosphate cytidylyltransferase
MKKYKIGYTTGVFDMFHIGHLNLIRNAKARCDYLIVAVSTDALVMEYKNKQPIIPFEDRKAIIEALRYVDKVVPQTSVDVAAKKQAACDNKIDVMFVGDDWKGSEKWMRIEQELNAVGVSVEYLPHTDGISSSQLRSIVNGDSAKG